MCWSQLYNFWLVFQFCCCVSRISPANKQILQQYLISWCCFSLTFDRSGKAVGKKKGEKKSTRGGGYGVWKHHRPRFNETSYTKHSRFMFCSLCVWLFDPAHLSRVRIVVRRRCRTWWTPSWFCCLPPVVPSPTTAKRWGRGERK